MLIRTASPSDVEAITALYNATIIQGPTTAQLDPVTLQNRMEWFRAQDRMTFPVWVAEEDFTLYAYLSFNPYRPGRRALDHTVEVSYFVHPDHQGKGLASLLMQTALDHCPELGIRSLLAILLETNTPSQKLLEKFGFQRWGTLPGVAEIGTERVGQYYYGLSLS